MLVPIRCAQAISCSRGRPRSRAMHPTPEVNPKLAHQFATSAASAACSGYESLAHLSRLLHKSQLLPLPRTKGKAQFKVCIRTRAIALYPHVHVRTRARSAHTARGRRHTRACAHRMRTQVLKPATKADPKVWCPRHIPLLPMTYMIYLQPMSHSRCPVYRSCNSSAATSTATSAPPLRRGQPSRKTWPNTRSSCTHNNKEYATITWPNTRSSCTHSRMRF